MVKVALPVATVTRDEHGNPVETPPNTPIEVGTGDAEGLVKRHGGRIVALGPATPTAMSDGDGKPDDLPPVGTLAGTAGRGRGRTGGR
jgi:hypothetical protein